jgi:hypothetical protein
LVSADRLNVGIFVHLDDFAAPSQRNSRDFVHLDDFAEQPPEAEQPQEPEQPPEAERPQEVEQSADAGWFALAVNAGTPRCRTSLTQWESSRP